MTDDLLKAALQHHQAKRFEQAEGFYLDILIKEPDHVDALYLMGILKCEIGNYVDAQKYTEKAIQLNPDNVEAYIHLGHIFKERGLVDEAIDNYQCALLRDPENAELYFCLGNALLENNLLDQALRCYQRTIAINSQHCGALNNSGNICRAKGLLEQARNYYEVALKANAQYPDTYNNLGNLYREMGYMEEAVDCYQKAIAINPQFAEAYNNLGNIFKEKRQPDLAAHWYERALEINPNIAQTCYNLGVVLYDQGKLNEAMVSYERAIKLKPDYADAYVNLGVVMQDRRRICDAVIHYQKAVEIRHDFAEAHWNVSLIHLLNGRLKEGWQGYEWRLKIKDIHIQRPFFQPLWDGSDIEGRTILLITEQGYGDAIQFIRYASLVAKRKARVIIECQEELSCLFQGVEGVAQVVIRGDTLPDFDVYCPLLSLPMVFDTILDTIPANIPYMKADKDSVDRWRREMDASSGMLKVGVLWAGKPSHQKDRERSIHIDQFSPLVDLAGVVFFSLQKGEAALQAKDSPLGMRLLDHTADLHDFLETAALIENLDLVISVDTAVAHLAGAMGKPVWTLLPYSPDWRWLLEGDTTPWYPTMRLFRQESLGEWGSVIVKVREELERLAGGNG